MNKFHSTREARDFVVSAVVEEAQREGAPLSELERKMLYVSAPQMSQAEGDLCAEADCKSDQDSYEKKIAGLIRRADRRYRAQDAQEHGRWRSATQVVLQDDHYIGVMIARANLRPSWDFLKLIATATLIVGVLTGAIVLMAKWGIDPSPHDFRLWVWAAFIAVAAGYTVVRLVVGKVRSSHH